MGMDGNRERVDGRDHCDDHRNLGEVSSSLHHVHNGSCKCAIKLSGNINVFKKAEEKKR
jgi:hypothetical protein